jgi:L-asparaginase
MQPASVRASDAEFNVGFALAAAQTLPPGVYVAMNGMIFDPEKTVKDRAGARFVQEG